jgi:hypothetical protein
MLGERQHTAHPSLGHPFLHLPIIFYVGWIYVWPEHTPELLISHVSFLVTVHQDFLDFFHRFDRVGAVYSPRDCHGHTSDAGPCRSDAQAGPLADLLNDRTTSGQAASGFLQTFFNASGFDSLCNARPACTTYRSNPNRIQPPDRVFKILVHLNQNRRKFVEVGIPVWKFPYFDDLSAQSANEFRIGIKMISSVSQYLISAVSPFSAILDKGHSMA